MSDKYLQMGNWFDQMNIQTINFEYLEKKYGENFRWKRDQGAWFFNEKKREVTFYDIYRDTIKTYKLDKLKEKAKKILKEKSISLEPKVPTKYVSEMVGRGIDNELTKNLSEDNIMLSLGLFQSFDFDKNLNEEEKEIFNAIPFYESKDIFLPEITEEKKFNIFMATLHKLMQPLKVEEKND